MVNATSRLFAVQEVTTGRPGIAVPKPQVVATEDDLTPVAGVALWGPLLDRLGLIDVADELVLRQIGPGGYSGGTFGQTSTADTVTQHPDTIDFNFESITHVKRPRAAGRSR